MSGEDTTTTAAPEHSKSALQVALGVLGGVAGNPTISTAVVGALGAIAPAVPIVGLLLKFGYLALADVVADLSDTFTEADVEAALAKKGHRVVAFKAASLFAPPA